MDILFNVPDFTQIKNPALFWFLSFLCAFSVGFSKNGVSGVAILIVPLMAMIFPAKQSTGILLPLLVAGDCVAILSFRNAGDWKYIIKALPWALLGITAGWFAMLSPQFNGDIFRRFIGSTVLFVMLLGEWLARKKNQDSDKLRFSHSLLFIAFFGILGGFATMTANAAGPVFAVYLLALGLPKENFIGSTARIFLVLNIIKIPFSAQLGLINIDTLTFNVSILPALALGAYLGFKTAKVIPQKTFNLIVKILASIAAIKLIF